MNTCSTLKEETRSLGNEKTEELTDSGNKNMETETLTTYKCERIPLTPELFISSKIDSENKVSFQLGKTKLKYDYSLKNLPEDYKESYTTYINEVKALASIPIIKSIPEDYIKNFKHFNLRYYEDKYCTNFGVTEYGYNDINIRIHTNKLLLLALASGNDIIRNGKPIVYITFIINDNDRSNVSLSGKKKKGSKLVERSTILCQVKCQDDDKLYNIRSGISGRIIEINEHIKAQPDLLRTDPKGVGFIAVLSPKGKEPVLPKSLLSEDEYVHYMMRRQPKCPLDSAAAQQNPSSSKSGT